MCRSASFMVKLCVLAIFVLGIVAEPTGDNVCKVEKIEKRKSKEAYNHTYPYSTTENCGFLKTCKVTKYATRILYRDIWKNVTVIVTECCPGYAETQTTKKCIPVCEPHCEHGECVEPDKCDCANGFTGSTCSIPPPPAENLLADPIRPESLSNEPVETHAMSSTTVLLLVLGVVSMLLLLISLVFYYRRKYMREKDPELPTVTFNKTEPMAVNNVYGDGNEFDNPMYASPNINGVRAYPVAAAHGYPNPMAGMNMKNSGAGMVYPASTLGTKRPPSPPPSSCDDGIYETTDSLKAGSVAAPSESAYSAVGGPMSPLSSGGGNEYELPTSTKTTAAVDTFSTAVTEYARSDASPPQSPPQYETLSGKA